MSPKGYMIGCFLVSLCHLVVWETKLRGFPIKSCKYWDHFRAILNAYRSVPWRLIPVASIPDSSWMTFVKKDDFSVNVTNTFQASVSYLSNPFSQKDFDTVWSYTDTVLSTKTSANIFNLVGFNKHCKWWLNCWGWTNGSHVPCHNFSISSKLIQNINFPTWIPD